MANGIFTRATWLSAVIINFLGPAVSHADIFGFGDFSAFEINQWDAGAVPAPLPNEIHLVNHSAGESRSIFYVVPQGIEAFSASFQYRASGAAGDGRFGAAFVLQNSPLGADAVADPSFLGVNTRFGYSDYHTTLNDSIGLTLEYGSLFSGSSSTGLYQNASVGGGSNAVPFSLFSGHLIDVSLTYNGTILRQLMTDTVTGETFDHSYLVDIPSIVGGDTAYVGFTAASATAATGDQYFGDLQFHVVPEPATLMLVAVASGALFRRRRAISSGIQ